MRKYIFGSLIFLLLLNQQARCLQLEEIDLKNNTKSKQLLAYEMPAPKISDLEKTNLICLPTALLGIITGYLNQPIYNPECELPVKKDQTTHLPSRNNGVRLITFSPYHPHIAVVHQDDSIWHWNYKTKKLLATLKNPYAYFSYDEPITTPLYLARGSQLAVISRPTFRHPLDAHSAHHPYDLLTIWDLAKKQILQEFTIDASTHSIASLPYGTGLALCNYNSIKTLHLGLRRWHHPYISDYQFRFSKMVPYQQGNFLITLPQPGYYSIRMWKPREATPVCKIFTEISAPLLITISEEDQMCAVANNRGETAIISLRNNKMQLLQHLKLDTMPLSISLSSLKLRAIMPDKKDAQLAASKPQLLRKLINIAFCPSTQQLAVTVNNYTLPSELPHQTIEIWRRMDNSR